VKPLPLRWRAHRLVLRGYRRLPVAARRFLVRRAGPTFSAGSIVLVEGDDDQVLLIRHSYRTNWGLPGGLLARRESPQEAARREVREEIGLEVELTGPGRLVIDPEARRLDFVFRARPGTPGPRVTVRPTSPEILEVRWFGRDALPALQAETAAALAALEGPEPGPVVARGR